MALRSAPYGVTKEDSTYILNTQSSFENSLNARKRNLEPNSPYANTDYLPDMSDTK